MNLLANYVVDLYPAIMLRIDRMRESKLQASRKNNKECFRDGTGTLAGRNSYDNRHEAGTSRIE